MWLPYGLSNLNLQLQDTAAGFFQNIFIFAETKKKQKAIKQQKENKKKSGKYPTTMKTENYDAPATF